MRGIANRIQVSAELHGWPRIPTYIYRLSTLGTVLSSAEPFPFAFAFAFASALIDLYVLDAHEYLPHVIQADRAPLS